MLWNNLTSRGDKCNFQRLSFTNKQKINFPWLNEMSARWRYSVNARTWEFAV